MVRGLLDYLQSKRAKENPENIEYQGEIFQDIEEEALKKRQEEVSYVDRSIGALFEDLYKNENRISNIDLQEVSNIQKHIDSEYNALKFKVRKPVYKGEKPELVKLKKCQEFSILAFVGIFFFLLVAIYFFRMGIKFETDSLEQELIMMGDFVLENIIFCALVGSVIGIYIKTFDSITYQSEYFSAFFAYGFIGAGVGLFVDYTDVVRYLYIGVGGILGLIFLYLLGSEFSKIFTYEKRLKENEEIERDNNLKKSLYNKGRNAFLKKENEKLLQEEDALKEKFQHTSSKELFTNYYLGKVLEYTYQKMAKQSEKSKLDETILAFLHLFDVKAEHLQDLNYNLDEISQYKGMSK